ncbi:TonB-dependent receptor [Phenylobacterium sp. LH3H17]|uniref:TonB-dependent receptor plug domain-containing protein n=1 Tax=Phenylobacterium sp. LH3H17 TaxID=2903901 RepID=UPI0020C9A210|nr:TonB-dependent receptor [Phenylobacterium sp. LH3H17]UTP38303.1 TonB-dependent receptor [Phenylobacterium sp. LH3H17]
MKTSNMRNGLSRSRGLHLGAASTLAIILATGAAHAQTDARSADTIDELIVTASRVKQDGFSAPTPTTVLSPELIASSAETTIADVLNTMPAFQPSRTQTTNTLNAVSAGANFLDLRGLGPNRTLVLLDGRRLVPTTDTNLVDVNLLPSALIERVEVVTGGASAAWGSDAVAGVTNFILKSKLEGLQGQVQFGRSAQNDGEEYKVALGYGGAFADGRGHFLLAGEVFENQGVLDQSSRRWAKPKWQFIANPAYAPGNGQPRQLIASNVNLSTATQGGLISAGPLRGTQFGPGGAPMPYAFGAVTSTFQIGGDGINLGQDVSIYQPNDRQSAFGRVSFDVTDKTQIFLEAAYGRSQSDNPVLDAWDFGSTRIFNDNAYLPAATRAAMAANGLTSFLMGRIHSDFGPISSRNVAESHRIMVGANGDFGHGWTWDGYFEYGRTLNGVDLYNNPIVARLALARDAVVNVANGQIVCRSTLTAPTNGCVPINLFGPGAAQGSPALAYVLGAAKVDYHLTQQVGAFNVQGSPFELWAGPVAVAAGVEIRREKVDSEVDPLSNANAYLTGNFKAINGSREIKEVYGEAVIPLAVDMPLIQKLDLNLAARLTDYSTSGSVTTWKVGLNHVVTDELRLRATLSRDIRAPNLNELFNPAAMTFATIFDPVKNASVTIQQIQKGNLALQPEEGETFTAGFVYEPNWLEGLRVSVDYFDIQLTGAISLLGIQDTINRCVAGNAELCSFLNRDGGGNLTSIVRTNYNLAARSTKGVDLEVAYSLPLSQISETLPGKLDLGLYGSHISELIFNDGTTSVNRAGNLSAGTLGTPEWKWSANANYTVGPFAVALQGRYISSGVYDSTYKPIDLNDNTIESKTYLDLSASYDLIAGEDGRRLTVYGAVDNLLDEDPPIVASSFFAPIATNPVLYDVMGRYFSMGVRFKY